MEAVDDESCSRCRVKRWAEDVASDDTGGLRVTVEDAAIGAEKGEVLNENTT